MGSSNSALTFTPGILNLRAKPSPRTLLNTPPPLSTGASTAPLTDLMRAGVRSADASLLKAKNGFSFLAIKGVSFCFHLPWKTYVSPPSG